eukprot:782453-Pyramimonas_sp.AAC.1
MANAQLHGCAYGLKNRRGQYMRKPRGIASPLCCIAKGLERGCDGSHKHVEARGKDCKLAQDYKEEFARRVHLLVSEAVSGNVVDHAAS